MNEVELLLDAFESAWIAGEPLSIDQFMSDLASAAPDAESLEAPTVQSPGFEADALLAQLVRVELEYRYKASSIALPDVSEYLQRYPQLRAPEFLDDLLAEATRLQARYSEAEKTDPLHTVIGPRNADGSSAPRSRTLGSHHPPSPRAADSDDKHGVNRLSGHQTGSMSANSIEASHSFASSLNSRFRCQAVLGKGSFGIVHRAMDVQLQRAVAIKTLHSALAADPKRREALVDEARRVAQFDHPNLITVYDVIEEAGGVHLVMQLVDGVPLDSWWTRARASESLDSSSEGGFRALASLMAQISRAIHHAHLAGCIHCDLKPQNILVDSRGVPTVLDFGLSIQRSEQGALAGRIFGTPAYMSPEQTWGENHHLDGRSDIWSLGAIIYRLLTGRLPFEAATTPLVLESIQTRAVTPLQQLREEVPDELSRIALRCLNKRIEDRYETAMQLATDLQAYADEVINRSLARQASLRSMQLKNCPFVQTELVGRDELIDSAIDVLMQGNQRLLTLTGSGGIGKTQTAVSIVHRLSRASIESHGPSVRLADFGDILWVDAANATNPDEFAAAVLAGIGVSQQADEPSAQRAEKAIAVRGPLMCVLDNLEQVIEDAASLIQRWLIVNPELRLIVTSQLPLQITGERVFRLPPLTTGQDACGATSGVEVVDQSSELFISRAKAVQPDLRLDSHSRSLIRQLGVLVDGNPLAIELAASRVGVLTLDSLLNRLTQSFGVLKNQRADRPDRHQSLKHVVGWSIDLLSESQTEALRRLAIWPAPIPMQIAEELLIHDEASDSVSAIADDEDALDVLDELRRRSLLRFRADGEVMNLHADNSIRRYLRDTVNSVTRHAVAHAMVMKSVAHAKANEESQLFAAIDRQHFATNLSLAVSWLKKEQRASDLAVEAVLIGDRMASDQLDSRLRIDRIECVMPLESSEFHAEWVYRLADARRLAGQTDEAERLCRELLGRIEANRISPPSKPMDEIENRLDDKIEVEARKLLARVLFRTGRSAEAIRLLEAAVDQCEQRMMASSLTLELTLELIEYERRVGHFDRAEAWLAKANATANLGASTRPSASALPKNSHTRTGLMIQEGKLSLQRGRIAEARNCFEQSVQATTRFAREPELLQQALLGRAAASAEGGDFAAAELDYDRCEQISRRLGDLPTLAQSFNNRALAADDSGDAARGCELLEHALEIYRGLGDRVGIAISLCAQAAARLSMGQCETAVTLLTHDDVTQHLPDESIHQAIRHGDLGVAYQFMGNLESAKSALSKCLAELDRLNVGMSAERLIYQVAYLMVELQLGEPAEASRQRAMQLVAEWRQSPNRRQRVQQSIESYDRLDA